MSSYEHLIRKPGGLCQPLWLGFIIMGLQEVRDDGMFLVFSSLTFPSGRRVCDRPPSPHSLYRSGP